MQFTTSQLAVEKVGNRYDLIHIASTRVRELNRGHLPMVKIKGSNAEVALAEIEAGLVGRERLLRVNK